MRSSSGARITCAFILVSMLFSGTLFADEVGNRRDFEGFWRAKIADVPPGAPLGGPPSGPPGAPPIALPGAGASPNPAELLPYNAAGRQVIATRREWMRQDRQPAGAHLTCRPTGVASLTPQAAALIAQTPEKLVFISQEDRNVRQIFMNQGHPKKIVPSYMGHSVGRWEGDTLVVDTIGYNGRGTIRLSGGMPGADPPTSEELHTVERWTKSADGNTLTIVLRVEDPVYYTEPFTQTYTLQRFTQRVRLLDYDCAENPREDDFEAWVFEDDWFKPVCVRPVRNRIASEKVICTLPSKSAGKE